MARTNGQLTITLHWFEGGRALQDDVSCDDYAPRDLIPILVRGCELPRLDASGAEVRYELRHDGEARPPLSPTALLSAQGVRTGSHVWLVPAPSQARPTGPQRCILRLPDGSEFVVPVRGQALWREWLLKLLELLNGDAFEHEMALLERDESRYRYVSNREHCALRYDARGYWLVVTQLTDVETLVNGEALRRGLPERLDDGAVIVLGRGGVEIHVSVV